MNVLVWSIWLSAADDRVGMLLASVLAEARRICGWHVTPEIEDTFVVDGPGGSRLLLPTMRLVEVTAVTEDGADVDVTTVLWSTSGELRKQPPDRYSRDPVWTGAFQGVTVEAVHGFKTADDFRYAVLATVDSVSSGGGNLVEKRVDDVTLRWGSWGASMFSPSLLDALRPYRLLL